MVFLFIFSSIVVVEAVEMKGYYRRDGRYVEPYQVEASASQNLSQYNYQNNESPYTEPIGVNRTIYNSVYASQEIPVPSKR
jgi:hypothetical protein